MAKHLLPSERCAPLCVKAAIQEVESVLDLGSETGRVAAEARRHTKWNIMGFDISTKMAAETR
jgi:predicted TPR repeat methyltransferase